MFLLSAGDTGAVMVDGLFVDPGCVCRGCVRVQGRGRLAGAGREGSSSEGLKWSWFAGRPPSFSFTVDGNLVPLLVDFVRPS